MSQTKDEVLEDGISVVVCVLNNEKILNQCLESLKLSKFNQLIVSDGGSIDKTVNIAKRFTKYVLVSKKGFKNQTLAAHKLIKYKYLFQLNLIKPTQKTFANFFREI